MLLELDALVEFGLAFVALGEEMEADALDVLGFFLQFEFHNDINFDK